MANRIGKLLLMVGMIVLSCNMAFAQNNVRKYVGRTETTVSGQVQVADDLVLVLNGENSAIKASLDNFSIFTIKGISITGDLVLDANGKVVSASHIVLKGAPGKVKTITGTVTNDKADLYLTGKGVGIISFTCHYVGSKQ